MKIIKFLHEKRERKLIIKNCKEIIQNISITIGERSFSKYENLNRTKEFIASRFKAYGALVSTHDYHVESRKVSNIIAEIPGIRRPERIILIGAHYDTVEGTPGADDNATAVAGLLEIYRLLSKHELLRTVRFVAFTLEEPPFFSSEEMGSMRYARECEKNNAPIDFMICLEMIGFANKNAKQNYPLEDMKKHYPPVGNYLAVVSLPSSSEFTYLWKNTWNKYAQKRKIYEMIGPSSIPGISLSDHYSFNKYGFKSIMLTDTGFFRNTNYHTEADTIDTLNFNFLSYNIWYAYLTLLDIANREVLPNEKEHRS
ncbi:MAG: M28 family peptidase [Spirochaetes bacterium]|nr:M28 family peptidase [Spirochaetota bacterium]